MNVDEVLAKMDTLDTNEEEIQYIIDENLRVISIPQLGVVLGVEGDKDVNSVKFKMVRYYKGIDLSKFEIRINFANANGDLSYYTVKNPTVTDDTLTFEWLVGYLVTKYKGTVRFVVRMIITDSSTGEVQQAFDTTIGEARSLEGLLVDTPTDEKVYDIVAQLKADLTDHVNNLLETIPEDYNELTKKVEDNTSGISKLKEDLDTLNQGGLNLKEDFIGKQVNNWLDEHPEATTTVQDGSLDEKKIQVSFRRKIKRTYRTFQDVLNDNSLETGTYIETTGFYSVDDGGGGLYLVSTYSPSDGNPCYFSYFGKYIVYIAKENVCNALALGIKKDGSVDCSDIVNKFFANKQVESKRYYSLYFPAGVYLFTNPIKIENATVYANILGCASSRGTYIYVYNDNFYPQYSATVFAFDIPKNTTAMTVNIEKNGSFNMNGIAFVSKSALFKSDGFETRPTVPYNVFSIEKKVENVNGLNIEKCRRSSVENCSFIGFSGYGLRSYSHNILNCFFSNCSVGVENNKSDLMLFNCFITSCENGIKAGCDGVIWASNTFIDQCVMHGILSENQSQTTLVLNGCIIDHIGYSGICVENALDANIDARMGRCGMYYAGKTTGFPDMPEDEKKKATTIYYGRLFHGNFRLNIYKRSITDDSANQDYVLPNVVFGGTYTNVVVTGLHYKDYLLFCNKENVHNTTIYADDGIHTYS